MGCAAAIICDLHVLLTETYDTGEPRRLGSRKERPIQRYGALLATSPQALAECSNLATRPMW